MYNINMADMDDSQTIYFNMAAMANMDAGILGGAISIWLIWMIADHQYQYS